MRKIINHETSFVALVTVIDVSVHMSKDLAHSG